jgi:hypothetical protein
VSAASRTKACAATKARRRARIAPPPLIAAKEKTPASRPADCIRPRYRKLPPDERERVAAGVSASGNAPLMEEATCARPAFHLPEAIQESNCTRGARADRARCPARPPILSIALFTPRDHSVSSSGLFALNWFRTAFPSMICHANCSSKVPVAHCRLYVRLMNEPCEVLRKPL